MKIKLLTGLAIALLSLAITLPVQTAQVTIRNESCSAFSATNDGAGGLVVTCSSTNEPSPPPEPPPEPTVAPVCGGIVTDTPGDNGVIYQGGSVKLTANCPGATSFAWSGVGTTATDTASTLDATPTAYTVYGVTGTNEFGSSAEILRLVAVLDPTTAPVCSPTATSATIDSGQSSKLNAGCDSATSYAWTSSTGETIDQIQSPIVAPVENTTYTLVATNAVGSSEAAVDVTISAGSPVTQAYSCSKETTYFPSIQQYYDNAGNAYQVVMRPGEAYAMSFTTGPASSQVQEFDFVEWSNGIALKDVTLAKEACNYIYPEYIARTIGDKVNIKFTVGVSVPISDTNPQALPRLEPNTQYHVNLRNSDPRPGGAEETCPNNCGFSFRFFSTVP